MSVISGRVMARRLRLGTNKGAVDFPYSKEGPNVGKHHGVCHLLHRVADLPVTSKCHGIYMCSRSSFHGLRKKHSLSFKFIPEFYSTLKIVPMWLK